MAPKRAAAKGAAAPTKPKANTKAKVTKPAPKASAAKNTTAAKAATRGRGRPKKAAAAAEKPAAKAKGPAKPKPTTTTTTTAKAGAGKKRKAEDEAAPAPVKKAKVMTKGTVITEPPSRRLHVFVFGEGTAGELGLGTAKNAVDVKRPRLNPNLDADKVGVVQIAAGGMHVVALTHDNKILTWGVNDQGALGRDTQWEGGLRDMDADEDSDDEDDDNNGLNPKESTPGDVDWSETEVAAGTRFVDVTAGDSTSFALTDDGRVYGWGTFRSNDGIFGFAPGVHIASRPVLIPDLKNITSVRAGANHALALDTKGSVFAWGSGQQNQLGRRVVERTKTAGLTPREFGLPKGPRKGMTTIGTGDYHSFAVSKTGDVYGWGLNNFGETGIPDNAGEDDAVVLKPQVIVSLKGKTVVSIKGAAHHSIAATEEGDCLVWGRMDGAQAGIAQADLAKIPEDAIVRDEKGKPRILRFPQRVAAIEGAVAHVTGSSDQNIAVTRQGKAWSWGFSANYQTGQGTTDDVEVATMIDNSAVRERMVNGAASGGQFGIITALAEE